MQWAWRAALSALVTLVLAIAPLAAQVVMASQAHASGHEVGASHFHEAHTNQAVNQAVGHPNSAVAGHSHHHDGGGDPAHHHDEDGVVVNTSQDAADHHDHGGSGDASCCGNFCHSAFCLTGVSVVAARNTRAIFNWANWVKLPSVDADQPQRPPSRLLS